MARHKVEICGVNTANIQVLTNEGMLDLFDKYKSGDNSAKDRLINARVLQLVQFQTGILPLYDKGFILSSFCYFSVVLYCVM